jgi:ribulose-phosphate 3-epimerase
MQSNLKRSVHLMVQDIKKYTDMCLKYKPRFITFHLEAVDNIFETIDYIKAQNVLVGISINPETDIDKLIPYLGEVDKVLLMSVKPGLGGQKFMDITEERIKTLANLKKHLGYSFLIEVDGGINDETVNKCLLADIVVVGSYIMKNDYEDAINKLNLVMKGE